MPRWWLSPNLTVVQNAFFDCLPSMLVPPLSPSLSMALTMTQKRASLDCIIEFIWPKGHTNVRLS